MYVSYLECKNKLLKNFTLNFLTYKNGTSYMLLCLDRQTDQITVSGHYILVPPCLLWKTQEKGENGSWY